MLSILFFSCTEPNVIGLEVQPLSDRIIINQSNTLLNFDIITESEDSLRSDEPIALLIGSIIHDDKFPVVQASFATQILLPSNNIDLGDIEVIDLMGYMILWKHSIIVWT